VIVNLRLYKSLACIGAILFLYGCSATEQPSYTISNLYIFGDSLSDTGNAKITTSGLFPDRNYYEGRFSDGPNYADQLGQKFNTPIIPARSFGSNYAFGGSRGLEVNAQVFNYKENAEGVAKEGAYYIVWTGANDLMLALQSEDPSTNIANAIGHIENAIRTLSTMGATKILVPNQPNMAKLPRFTQLGDNVIEVQNLTVGFNTALDEMLDRLLTEDEITTIKYDVFSLLENVIANPMDYDAQLNNVTEPCYVRDQTSLELTGDEEFCDNSTSYLFWDDIHPSTTTHSIIANEFHTALTAE